MNIEQRLSAVLDHSQSAPRDGEKPLAYIERISMGMFVVRDLAREFRVTERGIRLWCSTRPTWIQIGVRSLALKKMTSLKKSC